MTDELFKQESRLRDARIVDINAESAHIDDVSLPGLTLDTTAHALDRHAWDALAGFAKSKNISDKFQRLFAGEVVNVTESRAALHTALRGHVGSTQIAQNASELVQNTLRSMREFVVSILDGSKTSATGKSFTDVLHIGIGGSDLGPRLICDALAKSETDEQPGLRSHFLSNVDGHALRALQSKLDPESTLVTVCSKSFSTQETLTNAAAVKQWLESALGAAAGRHFVGITSKPEKAQAFGLRSDAIFPMWDWVGGRFSLWSAVGLPIALSLGWQQFADLLDGAASVDAHVQATTGLENAALRLGLLDYWYRTIRGAQSRAVVAYDDRLGLLVPYLQQLEMESCGKSVGVDGASLASPTGPIIWGGVGTDGQHAYFQWLHQSTDFSPVDFIGIANPDHEFPEQHRTLLANLLGQRAALMRGRSPERVAQLRPDADDWLIPHLTFAGNRPSNLLVLDRLNAKNLGSLLALYEHKVFVQGVLWDINPFDQWGVELGKQLANRMLQDSAQESGLSQWDASTQRWLKRLL